ncbi:Apoptosis-antagonizing transcription factor, C-terminal,AATF leucine zipper-containing domain [Cinara cedri]|uniref:Apoptosis-antagonizing transcription factor, C-terminal,AATF leucine zipper-containing domain n=1 Tax=Cinara cedri TaxID=506608 RepID=A0A5E4N987_9HEMI|nr:Apoptosis-antagonizing transcription factor, C-terminal,AATF leucine zipper-containing domain [Cinara cedri]
MSSDEEICSDYEICTDDEGIPSSEVLSERENNSDQGLSDESEIEDDESNVDNDDKELIIGSSQTDMGKAVAVQTQINLYDNLLLTRIKLQKCLVAANRLPQPEKQISSIESVDNSETIKSLEKFLDTLLNLKVNLLSNNNDFLKTIDKDSFTSKVNKHRGSEYVLQESHETFKLYRNETIRFWNERTKLASGKAAKTDFSAFDQPTLSQIEQIMSDKNRLIERTQTKRSKYDIVGDPETIKMDIDPEIFDDDDFYHKLLRDYIEKKSADVTHPNQLGKQWLQLQKLRSKMKRKIDTRSTKGRKLRYTVHTKLINFMAPNDQLSWSEEAKRDIYSSLFGKKSITSVK